MKLKQDVESSWKCPFVSASEGESEAQQAFCYVKSISLFLRVGRFVDANEEESGAQQAFCNMKTPASSRGSLCGCERGKK